MSPLPNTLSGMSEPSPELVARVKAEAESRHAHHEAGHAVAAVVRGGYVVEIQLGRVDWLSHEETDDEIGFVRHRTALTNQPFVTFAGPYAEAKWMVESDPDVDDLNDAIDYAWSNNSDGDSAKYDDFTAPLRELAAELGLSPVGPAWEMQWSDELDDLWPVIVEVAAMLLRGEDVTHAQVLDAINRNDND
jgi:hypothetical protein